MIYRFGDCEMDVGRLELRRAGAVQRLEPQVFDLLRYLVERNDQFVSKDEIFEAVWQGRIVSDSALASRIRAARSAIGDSGAEQRFIRTLHGRGFRFVASVSRHDMASNAGLTLRAWLQAALRTGRTSITAPPRTACALPMPPPAPANRWCTR